MDLIAEFGTDKTVNGEANFEVKRRSNVLKREFEVEVENAQPGTTHAVTLDGVPLGELKIDPEGEGELSVSDEDPASKFPDGFVEPKAGAVVKVGELFEGSLKENPPDVEQPAATQQGAN